MSTVTGDTLRARRLGASTKEGENNLAASPKTLVAAQNSDDEDDVDLSLADDIWDESEDAGLKLVHRGPIGQKVFGTRKTSTGERVACSIFIGVVILGLIALILGLAEPSLYKKMDEELRQLIMNGDAEAVKARLDEDNQEPHKGAQQVHAQGNQELTPLHWAAIRGQPNVADLLLERGAKVDRTSSSGMVALHYAARDGHVPLVDILVQHNSTLDALDNNGWTPMMWGVLYGHFSVTRSLIDYRADPRIQNYDTYHRTVLEMAEANRQKNLMPLLKEAVADADARDVEAR